MTDLAWLFVALAVFYGWECLLWLPPRAWVFVALTGSQVKPRRPVLWWGPDRWGWVKLPWLPPLGRSVGACPIPALEHQQGVLLDEGTASLPGGLERPIWLTWDRLKPATARGHGVWLGRDKLLGTASLDQAKALVRRWRELAALPGETRERRIAKDQKHDRQTTDLRNDWEAFQLRTRKLLLLANGLWFSLAVVFPFVVLHWGLRATWMPLLAVVFLQSLTMGWAYRRHHRELHPDRVEERFNTTLGISLTPLLAVRAVDLLGRGLFEDRPPLVVARALLSPEAFLRAARPVWVQWNHPLPHPASAERLPPVALEAWNAGRDRERRNLEDWIRQAGGDPTAWNLPPAEREEQAVAWCPRCRSQFVKADARCPDCRGLATLAFSTQPTPGSTS